ncbi:hypothetical protein MYX77_10220 [Acidobacteriia bacterium AH_259_A11_L15]|nr:hypothetical protein [Acidobacteriia bacterium AH_259_A11_L15]
MAYFKRTELIERQRQKKFLKLKPSASRSLWMICSTECFFLGILTSSPRAQL